MTDICMIVHNSVTHDGRVMKEAASLAAQGWQVTVIGLALNNPALPAEETVQGFTIRRVRPRLLSQQLPGTLGKLLRLLLALPLTLYHLRRTKARVYHAHDFTGLAFVALAGIWRRPVVYDSHELFFDQWPDELHYPLKRVIRLLRPVEKLLARRAAGVITVSDHIADHLAKTLKVERPVVLRNAVDLRHLGPQAAEFPAQGKRRIAHSGGLVPGRHLPELVAALAHLPEDVALVLMGQGSLGDSLLAQAEALGISDRLHIVPPVPPPSVAPTLAQADLAAVLTFSQCLNDQYALPNKLFEAVAAGLPLVVGQGAEIAALVNTHHLGRVVDPADPEAIAAAVAEVLAPEQYAAYRQNVETARRTLNWEQEESSLLALYTTLLEAAATPGRA